MKGLRRFVKRLAASVLGRRDDERMREELAEHLAMLTEEYLRAGLPLDEARRRARLKLGAPDALAEAYRDEQRLGWLEDLGKDVRYGLPEPATQSRVQRGRDRHARARHRRQSRDLLARQRGADSTAAVRDAEELMLVHLLDAGARRARRLPPDNLVVPQVRSRPRRAAGLHGDEPVHRHGMEPDEGWRPRATTGRGRRGGVFSLLGIDARLGRLFSADDDRVGATPVAVISHGLWQRRFGSDPDVLGKVDHPRRRRPDHRRRGTAGFRGLSGRADVWRPLKPTVPFDLNEPFSHSYSQIARRRPGVSIEQADAAVRVLGAQIDAAFPVPGAAGQSGVAAVSLDDERIDPLLRRAALVLLGAVGLVLLIACVNLANLTLVRGLARQREVAIRLALGASRLRIVRQFFTESLLLSFAGAAAGALVAAVSIRLASAADARLERLPAWSDRRPHARRRLDARRRCNGGVLGCRAGGRQRHALRPDAGMAGGARRSDVGHEAGHRRAVTSTGSRGLAFRNGLLVAEVALALVMLVSAGLMLKSLMRLEPDGPRVPPRSRADLSARAARTTRTRPSGACRSSSSCWRS